jgi:crotonobetainyl-CoA:carnitine CoA-transferase CaiB-like acyl-CoA transferase
MIKPLEDILVIDFSQFLSGPSGSLRMADLGARVIKIERPVTGDISRHLYISNVKMNGDSSVFHAINRNKESFSADLKDPEDCAAVRKLLSLADVVIHNFRPGVMKRLGFDYASVKAIKPDIIYGEISGYGEEGPWKDKPGQDLLVQSLSGICRLSGNAEKPPVAMGLSAVDILTGAHLVQGILACVLRKQITGKGGLIQVSMLESACDMQFETITTFYQDGGQPARRSLHNNAHAYLGAPYGVYRTADGFMALAMSPVATLGDLLACKELLSYTDPGRWFDQREQIKDILAAHLKDKPTRYWLLILEQADIWCAEVFNWDQLTRHEGFHALDMLQTVKMSDGYSFQTTSCPIRIDRSPLLSPKGTPRLGEDKGAIMENLFDKKENAAR